MNKYETPSIDITIFDTEDIMSISNLGDGTNDIINDAENW